MKSKIYLSSVISFTVFMTGCMTGWGREAKEPSSLNTYLNQRASQTAKPEEVTIASAAKSPEKHALVQSESAESSLAKKLAARLEESKKLDPQTTAEGPTYAARVQSLSLPEADKQQILEEFASASDNQWEELLSTLEPAFGPQQTIAAQAPAAPSNPETDMVQKYASKLVERHLQQPAANPAAETSPQRLPSTNLHQDTSHLAAADPNIYPKTIDLERGKTPAATRAMGQPQPVTRENTNIQLATYVPEMGADPAGLYPEDLQTEEYRQRRNNPKNLPNKKAGPKPSSAEEEDISQLSQGEYEVLQILWQRGQVSLEALHKQLASQTSPEADRRSPDPNIQSIDELHTLLFDLKERGWIADTRRGNTIVYWATRSQPEEETGNWKQMLNETIHTLEELASNTRLTSEERTIAQLRLRMLYLAADRKTDAMEKVEGLSPEEQEVWSNTLFGLSDYMNMEEIPLNRRHALALGSFRRAMTHLESASPLQLQNLEFIQSVDSFGQFKAFPSHDFKPQQEVLLYVEVDNFSSRDTGGQFETVLQSNYEIYDQSGRRIDARHFPEVKDSCRVRRRDFYVPYRIYMPENITPGTYRLELTVRDQADDKFGQASIEFQIK
ncbi:hypothetical protein DTL42_23195 [Bremerella cremea]|uniref:Uncharacterized protein n=1 Tax=Bremerella cremea TaxID=1031537 RepID=A0A368KND4_9BACT|nr:BlaI/MecI/CopY family transcriptional regulator [Bremerella cremea]RCS41463.1 hypothetical protein DTL42_23195 [Bremerella cremea]